MTGPSANIGVEGYKGFSLAMAELDEGGHGRRIESVLKDDAGDSEACLAAAKELYADGVRVFILHTTSGAAAGALPWLLERDVLVLTRTVSATEWAGRDDSLIRFVGSAYQFGTGLGRFMTRRGVTRVVTIVDRRNEGYAQAIIDGAISAMSGAGEGGAAIGSWSVGEGLDHAELARAARDSGAQAAFAVLSGLDAAKLAQALEEAGFQGDLYLSPWSQDHNLLSYAGKMSGRIFLPSSFNPDDPNPRYTSFVGRFRSVFGEAPVMSSLYGYEVAMFLGQGLSAADDSRPEALKRALLAAERFEGLQQSARLDEFGDLEMDMMIITIKAGRFEAAP